MQTFELGDEVKVKVYSIDEAFYDYFIQLNDQVESGSAPMMSSTRYNSQSNINNGAMGYFAAWTFAEKTIEIR